MKRLLIIALLLSSIVTSCKKSPEPITKKIVTISEAGSLSSLLSEEEILTLTELTVSGPLNGSDIRVLRNMAQNCALSVLNLKDALIVSGGKPYFIEYDDTPLYTIDNTITTAMFRSCSKLTSVLLPKNVKVIGEEAFCSCGRLSSITLPEEVKVIGEEAFYSCGRLSSITLPEEIDSIGDQAFYQAGITGELVLPTSLRVIGRRAFFKTKVQKVTIQSDISVPTYETMYEIGGNSPFACCDQLKEVVVCEGCTKLEVGFQGCESLIKVLLPSTLTHLGYSSSATASYVFKYCENLNTIVLPEGLVFIGQYCFYNSGLSQIVIPNSVQYIKKNAFSDIPLNTFIVKWNTPLSIARNVFEDTNLENATLIVPIGTKEFYDNAVPWKLFGSIREE